MANTTTRRVAINGATGTLGSRIFSALNAAGHEVTAVQRKDSSKSAPDGLKSVKVDYANKEELVSIFKGQDIVISYLTSVMTDTNGPTTWTSVNNGAFFDMTLPYGVLGPNIMAKKTVFHNGGDNKIAVSLLADIGTAIVKLLATDNIFNSAANQPVYICSAAITERQLTELVSEVTGIDFGSPEQVSVKELIEKSDERLKQGDKSAIINYYLQMMYGEGYKRGDFMNFNWNARLGLRIMSEQDLKNTIQEILGKFV
ncbi:NAD(P)-binding protein [Penicillium malachiteum]|uniref:NAD(P)-binding protein n=1 Tax=Penicillium malachiteum TaxID=1324776 RepID=A0AAD6HVE3_9EURO|nr:NAD(P)-binding protein [Penicillium malachiteum]